MDFLELAKSRYSTKKFNEIKVDKIKIDKIIEAGRIAPTAMNIQPEKVIIVNKEYDIKKLEKAVNIHGAQLALIVMADEKEKFTNPYDGTDTLKTDAAIMTTYMMLQATDLELKTCWITSFKSDVLKKEFNIAENLKIFNILAIGYSDSEGKDKDRYTLDRKKIDDVVYRDFFN